MKQSASASATHVATHSRFGFVLFSSSFFCATRALTLWRTCLVSCHTRVELCPVNAIQTPCRTPVDLPDRAIGQGEVFRFWARDRQALAECCTANGGIKT